MSIGRKIATVLYGLFILVCLLFGIRYITAESLMPYHFEAIGMEWSELAPGLQALMGGFMKAAAAAFLTTAFAMTMMLAIPFRKGEAWANWVLLGTGAITSGIILLVSYGIHKDTGAATPWPVSLGVLLIAVVAFVVAKVSEGKE